MYSNTQHHWSGWPGAFCLHCGSEDPLENAIGLNWYDPWTNKWDTEEHEKMCKEAQICTKPGPHNHCGQCKNNAPVA